MNSTSCPSGARNHCLRIRNLLVCLNIMSSFRPAGGIAEDVLSIMSVARLRKSRGDRKGEISVVLRQVTCIELLFRPVVLLTRTSFHSLGRGGQLICVVTTRHSRERCGGPCFTVDDCKSLSTPGTNNGVTNRDRFLLELQGRASSW